MRVSSSTPWLAFFDILHRTRYFVALSRLGVCWFWRWLHRRSLHPTQYSTESVRWMRCLHVGVFARMRFRDSSDIIQDCLLRVLCHEHLEHTKLPFPVPTAILRERHGIRPAQNLERRLHLEQGEACSRGKNDSLLLGIRC